jgi:hypothetical protein
MEALQKNELASESELFIYSDAPKAEQDQEKVQGVRDYIQSIGGFKKITIIEREENWGLANSIIDGVTEIVNRYGKIIVLEDDIVTSSYFLRYMNDALDYYQETETVMHVSGWNYPINTDDLPETIFLRGASCWGWATWSRAWQFFDKNPQKLSETFTKEDRYKLDYDGTAGMWSQVMGNLSGKLNTWAVFWYVSVFKNNGLCLHPIKSLVTNIGHDSSGTHCGASDMYSNLLSNNLVTQFSDEITENTITMDRIKRFLLGNKKSLFKRVLNKLTRRSVYE